MLIQTTTLAWFNGSILPGYVVWTWDCVNNSVTGNMSNSLLIFTALRYDVIVVMDQHIL